MWVMRFTYIWRIGLPLIPSAGNRAAIGAEGEGASNLTAAYDGVLACARAVGEGWAL
jgi:hypothetical protein